MITKNEITNFSNICKSTLDGAHDRQGIGTYKEKLVHMVLKAYFCGEENREIRVGKFIADGVVGNTIYEIQSAGFYPLKKKLSSYLHDTDMDIVIVRPVAFERRLVWVECESGEMTEPKKVAGDRYKAKLLRELLWIAEEIDFTRVKIKLCLMQIDEYKLLDGRGENKKIGASKLDRIPKGLIDIVDIDSVEALRENLLPKKLGESFTRAEFAKTTGLTKKGISAGLKALEVMNVIERNKTGGRPIIYNMKN